MEDKIAELEHRVDDLAMDLGGPHQYTFTDLIQAAMDKAYRAFVDHPCDEGVEIMNHLMEIKVILNGRNK